MAIGRNKWVILLVALTIAAAVSERLLAHSAPMLGGIIAAAVMLSAIGLLAKDWNEHDEASQAAHKAAWLWGGSFGLALSGALLAILLRVPEIDSVLPSLRDARPAGYFAAGVLATMLLQFFCYLVAWADWWVSKR